MQVGLRLRQQIPGLTRGQEATGSIVWLNVKKQPAMPWVLLLSCRRFHGPE